MTFSQFYKVIIGVFMICFLFAAIGFLIAYLGRPELGWKIGFTGAVIGNLMIIVFWLVKIFGRHSKLIKFDDK